MNELKYATLNSALFSNQKSVNNYKVNTNPSFERWQKLYSSSTTTRSFFQSNTCYNFYKKVSSIETFVVAIEDDNEILALVTGYIHSSRNKIISYFSRRAIIPGGILLPNNCPNEVVLLLLNSLKDYLKEKAIYIELRNLNDYSQYKHVFKIAGFKYIKHYNVQNELKFSTKEDLLSSISRDKKRQYVRSLKHGATIHIVNTLEEVKSVYQVLQNFYTYKLKLPLFDFDFFKNLFDLENTAIIVVKNNNQIVSLMVLVHDDICAYEWFVYGDRKQSIYPSVVVTVAGIQYAYQQKLKKFDFMGAGSDKEKIGLRKFKLRFGGELVENGRFLYICNPILFSIGKRFIQLRAIL